MPKEECQQLTREDRSKYRDRDSYAAALNVIAESESVDFKESKGLKYECHLNNLKYFHIIDNFNVDITHDIYEGPAPLFIRKLIKYCIDAKIFTFEKISSYVENFDYGKQNRHNVPSTLLDKHNIGQNSSQVRCLLLHLPYIFYDFKDNLAIKNIWPAVTSLLNIIRIVHSADVFEEDLIELDNLVSKHLELIKEKLDISLKPRHHFMTHYASVFRLTGPIVHSSTMRFEAKHKVFTDQVKLTNNFVKIGQWLAQRYQRISCFHEMYVDEVNLGKLSEIDQSLRKSYNHLLYQIKDFNASKNVSFVQINSNMYTKGLFIIDNSCLYQIEAVIHNNTNFFFVH